MSSETLRQRPSEQRARAVTRPAGVSSTTVVSGSCIGNMPSSSKAVTTQMQLLPDMGWALSA